MQACYGVTDTIEPRTDWVASDISILFGGTIAPYTGATLLIDMLKVLRERKATASRDELVADALVVGRTHVFAGPNVVFK